MFEKPQSDWLDFNFSLIVGEGVNLDTVAIEINKSLESFIFSQKPGTFVTMLHSGTEILKPLPNKQSRTIIHSMVDLKISTICLQNSQLWLGSIVILS